MTDSENDSEERYSNYLQYLPAFYREDDFTGRFLNIFEDILKPIESVVDNLAFYFDPGTTPQSFLPWLASWVGLVLDERWPEAKRRELIKSMAELYRWWGTKRGLSEYLRIYTGIMPQILEHAPATQPETNTNPDTAKTRGTEEQAHCFTVILEVPDVSTIDADIVRSIIESEKPAHTTYILQISERRPKI